MLSEKETNLEEDFFNKQKGFSTSRALNDILKALSELQWVLSSAVIRRDGILMASVENRPISKDWYLISNVSVFTTVQAFAP